MKLAVVVIVVLAFGALAQDRTVAVPEAGVVWLKTEIVPPSPDDGGCIVFVYASNDAGISVTPQPYPYNGNRCVNTVRPDSLKAAKKDLGVGNGSSP
jgi:hypothetical protein